MTVAKTLVAAGEDPRDTCPLTLIVTEHTVVIGRGACSKSQGNQYLSSLIRDHAQECASTADRQGKSDTVTKIMNLVQEAGPGGEPVRYDKREK